jgi:hypothetical protein
MNLVAAAGELKPQFGSDNSAAAVGWITGDANLHAPPDPSPNDTTIGFAGRAEDADAGELVSGRASRPSRAQLGMKAQRTSGNESG